MSRFPPIRSWSSVAAPLTEPVTLIEAKLHVRADHTEAEDAYIVSLIAAARAKAENDTQRLAIQREVTTKFSSFPAPGREMLLPWHPLKSVTEIVYFDTLGVEQTLSPSSYVVRTDTTPGTVQEAPGFSWPATAVREDAVRVRYQAGYGKASDVDPRLKHMILLLVGHLYENREATSVGVKVEDVPLSYTLFAAQLWTGVMR